MSRSKWKGGFLQKSLFKKTTIKDPVKKVWSRDVTIPNSLLNSKVLVHTGNSFRFVFINRDKLGLKFGEFAFTRKRINKYSGSKVKKPKKI
jgi:small subunit ribosomal protein S19